DLAVEDLIDRLHAGKVYAPDKVEWALEHFFKPANLSTLRELSLREVAESLERSASAQAQAQTPARAGAEPRPAGGRVMVCLSSHPPRAAVLLRRGPRMAGRLSTAWFVGYVEPPR